ncbi:transient receptor potential cation channel subfamily V member 5-like [Mizuhopecten yessoensis]|uniref:Transient receptor potential cation channel subfamily V member 6 n=1 Tax=Mizuhopecten yessoensis TaxID=6573 RepID=A0A210PTX0_MIZYE|nr:transient receptor potential cation channel subfamily V member 5-like [Mizuhopecten yessoensis]OWF39933.1 Transient receptor potential cation channel subfamily V member 6 [Mizuhopecten yessoensis]
MADGTGIHLDPATLTHLRYLLENGEPLAYRETESLDSQDLASARRYEDGTELIQLLKEFIEEKDIDEAKATLQKFVALELDIREFQLDIPQKPNERTTNETILHHAAKYDTGGIVSAILDKFPVLVSEAKKGSEYKGQTALHIAITRANNAAIALILRTAKRCDEIVLKKQGENEDEVGEKPRMLENLLNTRATGSRFEGTVMMGELPLFVAALKFDFGMVDKLIDFGANICTRNESYDTIFHSMIRYLSRKRDKEDEVKRMMSHLTGHLRDITKKKKEEMEKEDIHRLENSDNPDEDNIKSNITRSNNYVHLWLMKDKDGLTPLKLAAKHQLVHIFEYILELKDVYCFQNEDEGLFDIKKYDVTEIDSIANTEIEETPNEEDTNTNTCCSSCRIVFPKKESILEMLFDKNYTRKFSSIIIEMMPVKKLIQKKWKNVVSLYSLWMLIQVVLMVFLSVYAVERSYWHESEIENTGTGLGNYFKNNQSLRLFLTSFQWIAFIIAIFYVIIVILCVISKLKRPNPDRYYMHNIEYILLMLIFALAVIVDVLITQAVGRHDGIPLIIALFSGWWFNVFFLRGWHLFSFFTVMIKEVIFGDFLRFSVIIAFQLFAFTTCMHTMFQGKDVPAIDGSDDNHFFTTLITMFNLMLGLGEIECLSQARVKWLALTLFVLFVLLTYVLLLNALIAMMSSTCESVLSEKYSVWRIQQLSIILFIEDLFLVSFLQRLTRSPANKRYQDIYDPIINMTSRNQQRYMLDMQSRKMTFTEEETDVMKRRTQEEIRKTVNQKLKQNMEESISGPKKSDEQPLVENDFLTRDIEGPKLKPYTREFKEELPKIPEDNSTQARVSKWMSTMQ